MIKHHWTWHRLSLMAREEWRQFVTIAPSDRPWQMPLSAALAAGLPLLVGAGFDRIDYGLISSLGGMVFLYLPRTPLHHRMASMMAAGFGYIACYTLGIFSHLVPLLIVPTITLIATLVTMLCRFYRIGPPGSMFFVMAAAIAAYTPADILQLPLKVGLFSLGALLAALIAFAYSLFVLRIRAPLPVEAPLAADFDFVVLESVIIGLFVAISLTIAQALQLDRPYWVPVSCLAVIQGMNVRAIWNRQLHRLFGTALGVTVAAVLLSLPLEKWSIAFAVIALSFVVETAVIRHYGFAVIFITPLTIFLADAASLGHGPPNAIIEARFVDTLLGCLAGLIGGVCLHNARFRGATADIIRKAIPASLIPARQPSHPIDPKSGCDPGTSVE